MALFAHIYPRSLLFFEVLGPARDVRKKDVRPRRFIQAKSLAERFFFRLAALFVDPSYPGGVHTGRRVRVFR